MRHLKFAALILAVGISLVVSPSSAQAGVPAPSHDFSADGHPDLLATTTDGNLFLFRGTNTGFAGGSTLVGTGWQSMTAIMAAGGDWNGDGRADLLARTATGDLKIYHGNGAGFSGTSLIGQGFTGIAIVAPGDWNNDGHPDLIARFPDGNLKLFLGTGAGLAAHPATIGSGFNGLKLIACGDWNNDGHPDLITQNTLGQLFVFYGNGAGFLTGKYGIGSGFKGTRIVGVGDWNADGQVDLIVRVSTGALKLFSSTPGGGIVVAPNLIGTGFGGFAQIL